MVEEEIFCLRTQIVSACETSFCTWVLWIKANIPRSSSRTCRVRTRLVCVIIWVARFSRYFYLFPPFPPQPSAKMRHSGSRNCRAGLMSLVRHVRGAKLHLNSYYQGATGERTGEGKERKRGKKRQRKRGFLLNRIACGASWSTWAHLL